MVERKTPTRNSSTVEIVEAHQSAPSARTALASKSWKWITSFLAAVVTIGTMIGVLGRAFYVSRDEYTKSETVNAVTHEAMRQTLDRVDRTLNSQTQVLGDMAKAIQAQAVEMARRTR